MRDCDVLSLCDRTGEMVKPWSAAGYKCECIDIQHSILRDHVSENITYRWGDVRTVEPKEYHPKIVFTFPPCTHLAISGARDFERKGLQYLIDALQVVENCRKLAEWFDCPWMLENPIGRLSSFWCRPNYSFDPCDYAGYLDDPGPEAYTKRTCLWTGGGIHHTRTANGRSGSGEQDAPAAAVG